MIITNCPKFQSVWAKTALLKIISYPDDLCYIFHCEQLVTFKLVSSTQQFISLRLRLWSRPAMVACRSYLGVGLLGDVDIFSSVGLTPPLVVPHLRHQLQMSLGLILFFIWTHGDTNKCENHTETTVPSAKCMYQQAANISTFTFVIFLILTFWNSHFII